MRGLDEPAVKSACFLLVPVRHGAEVLRHGSQPQRFISGAFNHVIRHREARGIWSLQNPPLDGGAA